MVKCKINRWMKNWISNATFYSFWVVISPSSIINLLCSRWAKISTLTKQLFLVRFGSIRKEACFLTLSNLRKVCLSDTSTMSRKPLSQSFGLDSSELNRRFCSVLLRTSNTSDRQKLEPAAITLLFKLHYKINSHAWRRHDRSTINKNLQWQESIVLWL